MASNEHLTDVEQLILLGLVRLGDNAYGVSVREEVEQRAGRSLSIASTYEALDRLERRGFVSSWISEAVPRRGGRARKHFRITQSGARALKTAQEAFARMREGLEEHPDLNTI